MSFREGWDRPAMVAEQEKQVQKKTRLSGGFQVVLISAFSHLFRFLGGAFFHQRLFRRFLCACFLDVFLFCHGF